ncbi:hypothetical protein QT19_00115, partial [Staphylococcus aureus]
MGRSTGLLGDDVDDAARLCLAVEHRHRPLDQFDMVSADGRRRTEAYGEAGHAVGQDGVSIVARCLEAAERDVVARVSRALDAG